MSEKLSTKTNLCSGCFDLYLGYLRAAVYFSWILRGFWALSASDSFLIYSLAFIVYCTMDAEPELYIEVKFMPHKNLPGKILLSDL